jgi:hypothetical protein
VLKQPQLRVTSLTVELAALSQTQQDQVLTLDLTSPVDVEFTPNRKNIDPGLLLLNDAEFWIDSSYDARSDIDVTVRRSCVVEGISHTIGAGGTSHVVTLSLGDALFTQVFVLDDAELGVLDDDILAF